MTQFQCQAKMSELHSQADMSNTIEGGIDIHFLVGLALTIDFELACY